MPAQPLRWEHLSDVELDNLVVASLTDSFRTEISTETAKLLNSESPHEVTSLLVLAPRLWWSGHRHSLSLRHPRTSFSSWSHRVGGGKQCTQAYDMMEATSSSALLLQDFSATAARWGRLITVHKTLLASAPELGEARRRVLFHPSLKDVITRIWVRLVGNPLQELDDPGQTALEASPATLPLSSSAKASTNAYFDPPGGPTVKMSAKQYVYFECRIAQQLFPECALIVTDMFDVIERDMLIDMYRPPCLVDASDKEDTITPFFDHDSLQDILQKIERGEISTEPPIVDSKDDNATVESMYGGSYQEKVWGTLQRVRDYRKLPGVTFESFFMSMLELADNWTSSTNPLEYAAFLFDLYEKVFTQDWSADADAVILRAAIKHKAVIPQEISAPALSGPPVYASKRTQSSANAAQLREYRRESKAQVSALLEHTNLTQQIEEMSMGQLMMLPQDARSGLLDGTSEAVIDEDDFVQLESLAALLRRPPPIVDVRYVPQFIRDGYNSDGMIQYTRGEKRFAVPTQVLMTLTSQDTIERAVEEVSRPHLNVDDVSKRKPYIHLAPPKGEVKKNPRNSGSRLREQH